jgi:hypothetical protein
LVVGSAEPFPLARAESVPHVESGILNLLAVARHGTAVAAGHLIHGSGLVADAIHGGRALAPHPVFASLLSIPTGGGAGQRSIRRCALDALLVNHAITVVVYAIAARFAIQHRRRITVGPVPVDTRFLPLVATDVAGERLPIRATRTANAGIFHAALAWRAIAINFTLNIFLASTRRDTLKTGRTLFVGCATRLLADPADAKLGS